MADSEKSERGRKRQTSDSDSDAEDPDRERRKTATCHSQRCWPGTSEGASQQTARPERGRKRQASLSSTDSDDADSKRRKTGGAMTMHNEGQATGNIQARRLTQNIHVTDEEMQKLKNLITNTEQYIATACPQGYVETLALRELEEELEDSGVCLVLGLPGHGKTSLALQAMGRLADLHQFKPVWLTEPKEWKLLPGEGEESSNAGRQVLKHHHAIREIQSKARSEQSQSSGNTAGCSDQHRSQGPSQKKEVQDSRRYVVLLDDVFGKGHYDAAKKKAWEEVFDLVLAKVRAKQVKVILVSRVHIYEECKKSLGGHQLFDDVKTIDLRKSEYWTFSDRIAILENFLQEKEVRVDTPIRKFIEASESCTQIGFPQACRFFASEKQAQLQGPDFFHKPLQFLHKQFEQMQENDVRSYLVLILTWLEGGILSSEYLDVDNTDTKRRISDLCEQFDVKDVMTIREVQTKARSLCGVYLSEDEEGSFRFTHQTICDSLVVAMCNFNLKRALDVCSVQQACEYIRTKKSNVDQSGLTYTVPKCKWPLLTARLVKAMASEKLLVALDHPSLRDEEFVSVLVDIHLMTSHIAQMMQRECKIRMSFAVHFPSDEWLCCLMETSSTLHASLLYQEAMTTTSIVAFLISRQSALVNRFLKVDILRSLPEADASRHLREALQAACYVSNEALVTDLLERRAEVTPDTVRAACTSERDDVITLRKVIEKLPKEQLNVFLHRELMWHCCLRSKVESLKVFLTEVRLEKSQKNLDQVFSELVRLSCSSLWRASHCLKRLSEILSALKTAGARLDKTTVDLRFAAGHPSAFALKEHLAGDTSQLSTVFPDGSTPLHEAAGHGSLECLEALMESPATKDLNVNALDDKNQTPLSRAVAGNDVKTLEFLLKHGADPNIGSIMGNESFPQSPLHAAAARHQLSAMKLLLQHNASTDVTDEWKRTPLHWYAAYTRRFAVDEPKQLQEQCEDLLMAKTPNINQKDDDGSAPLHLACEASQTSLVQKLLTEKARVDVVDSKGRTVLHTLADSARYQKGRDDADKIVEMVVDTYYCQHAKSGEEPRGEFSVSVEDWINSTDMDGRTPLHVAAEKGNVTVVKALLKRKAKTEIQDVQGWTPLHVAADIAVMDELIAHDAKVDAEDNQKRVPLITCAARIPNATNRRFLRQLNPELTVVLDRQNAQGQTALHIAAARGGHSFIHSLLKAGARADLVDSECRLPLHCWAAGEEQNIFDLEKNYEKRGSKNEKELVRATPDVNVQDKYGKTPLHLAAEHGSLFLIKFLLDKGVTTDTMDHNHRLPLHCMAARETGYGEEEKMSSLVKKVVIATPDVSVQDKYGKTPLHLAADHGNFSLISILLDTGARTDTKDDDHRLPLHCMAAWCIGNWEVGEMKTLAAKRLVSATPDVNVQDKYGMTPLHLAAGHANISLISNLLDKNARTDTKDDDDRLPLHCMAARETDEDEEKKLRFPAEKKLVSATPDVNVQDKFGKTPLHLAAEHGNFFLISVLLAKAARTDTSDNDDRFPLHCMAAGEADVEEDKELRCLMEKLVRATPDVNVQDKYGKTPLHLAAEQGKFSLITTLLAKDAIMDIKDNDLHLPLHCMAAGWIRFWEDEEMRSLLLKFVSAICDVHVQDKYGKTPLHLAAEHGNYSLISILLEMGAMTDTTDHDQCLPLHYMAAHETVYFEDKNLMTLAEKLVSATPDVHVQDKYGKTPLHLAAEHGSHFIVAALLDKGARTDTKDHDHQLPLHCLAARKTNYWEDKDPRTLMEKRLVSATPDVNVQDKNGMTPLHLAAEHDNYSLITTILDKCARTDIKDENLRLPLHYLVPLEAKMWEDKNLRTLVEKKLASATSDVNVQDKYGKTPLHLAAEHGSLFIITTLLNKGAMTDTKDDVRRLPLHYMAARKTEYGENTNLRTLTERKLVNATPDVNAQDKNGKTPLHLAAEHGSFSLITALLDKGARTDTKDDNDRLPLHCMAAQIKCDGNDKDLRTLVEEKLVSATPDVNVKEKYGKTPLQLAEEHSNFSLMAVLQKDMQGQK